MFCFKLQTGRSPCFKFGVILAVPQFISKFRRSEPLVGCPGQGLGPAWICTRPG
ncbi:hypothetical protein M404DRAFT_992383, partial [Pisolithus tinctorius Marx 270]